MADHPILFSESMIRALLREIEAPGTGKTQTRRVLTLPTKTASGGPIYERPDMGGWEPTTHGGGKCFTFGRDGSRLPVPEMVGMWHRTTGVGIVTPHQAGDRLWVRETWAVKRYEPCLDHERDWQSLSIPTIRYAADGAEIRHQGDRATGRGIYHGPVERGRPSIHMPRWASRLTLYVSEVRVERLQDISRADAIAEGLHLASAEIEQFWRWPPPHDDRMWLSPIEAYRHLWDRINGPGAWDANPWVACYSFKPVFGNIDTLPATLQEAA